jgi:glycosyltransferase involved in cell wall biosynthesis
MPDRERVLQLGPDASIGGGMAAVIRGLLTSPLGDSYRLDAVATYDGSRPLRRLFVFAISLLRLATWSLTGRGRIVHVHMTVRGSMYRKSICVLLARALRRRVVLHIHSGPGDLADFRKRLSGVRWALIARALAAADVVLAVSSASARVLRERFGVAEVTVVPNAAPDVVEVERDWALNPADVGVVYLGGFANLAKGGDVMVAATEQIAASASAPLVTLAGPGDLPPGAEPLLSSGRVTWAGWLDADRKDALLREAEVLVLASRSEGLPVALLEGMAYGMAVVATAVGGMPEVLEDGRDGVVVASEDPEQIADAVIALAGDRDRRAGLGAAARQRVASFSVEEIAARLAAIYRQLG